MLPLFQSTPTVKILSSAAISNSMFPFVVPRYGRAFTASSALLGGRLVAKSSSVIHSIQHKNHHYHHHESSHRRLFHHTGLQSWSSKADLTDDDGSASIKYYNTRGQESKEQSGSDVDENIDYLKMVLQAKVYDVADESPLTYAKNISRRMNNSIHLKREDLQRVFSFKLRGAYNKIVSLSKTQRNKGVICASAGNHAQGVALAAKKLGIKSTIVMPVFAPKIKVNNVKSLGGNVILYGDDFDAAKAECTRLIEETGMTFIHPVSLCVFVQVYVHEYVCVEADLSISLD